LIKNGKFLCPTPVLFNQNSKHTILFLVNYFKIIFDLSKILGQASFYYFLSLV
jgi:hypothetical protein